MTTMRPALAVVEIAGDRLAVGWWLPRTPTLMASSRAAARERRRAMLRMWTVKSVRSL
jgi:hypothetical protein